MTSPAPSPWRLISQHSTALLAVVYLFSAVAGATYHYFLFDYFGLYVFDYWELADFLSSGIREPRILFFALMAVSVAAGVIWNEEFDNWASEQGPVTRVVFGNTLFEKVGLSVSNYPLIGILVGGSLFAFLAFDQAKWRAESISNGDLNRLVVTPGPDGSDAMRAGLISRTYALAILVGIDDGRRYAVPLEPIDAMTLCSSTPWNKCLGKAPGKPANENQTVESKAEKVTPTKGDTEASGDADGTDGGANR